jgi:hypothetical protein
MIQYSARRGIISSQGRVMVMTAVENVLYFVFVVKFRGRARELSRNSRAAGLVPQALYFSR